MDGHGIHDRVVRESQGVGKRSGWERVMVKHTDPVPCGQMSLDHLGLFHLLASCVSLGETGPLSEPCFLTCEMEKQFLPRGGCTYCTYTGICEGRGGDGEAIKALTDGSDFN